MNKQTRINELQLELQRLRDKHSSWRRVQDGSYGAALNSDGYFEKLKELRTLTEETHGNQTTKS
jgi:hypothetical protein